MDLTWCKKSDSGLLKPDLVIFLDIDPIVAQSRGEYGVERYENLEIQKLVRSNYLKLKDETWKVKLIKHFLQYSCTKEYIFRL